jgi:hypothetical protein
MVAEGRAMSLIPTPADYVLDGWRGHQWKRVLVTNGVALVCESEAALSDRVIGALDCGEAAVGERFADELPKVFGRLELGTPAPRP